MGKIIEASELPENEKVYLKKDFLGWRVVEPIKNEDDSINWFNLLIGGKKGLAIILVLLFIGGMFYLGFQEQIGNFKKVVQSPCDFCTDCQQAALRMANNYIGYKVPEINFTFNP